MTRPELDALIARYLAYVQTFARPDGSLEMMHQLKLDHTRLVVEAAQQIMRGEAWNGERCLLGEAGAWLHDAGRYSQFAQYQTFRDSESIDHAVQGVKVIRENSWLSDLSAAQQHQLLTVVAVHNKKEIPSDLDAETALLAHLVRDADKLDIFRIFEEKLNDGSFIRNPEIAWNVDIHGAPNPRVLEAICRGDAVEYSDIHSLSDFVLIQIGWLNGGLYYKTTRQIARERKILELQENFLHQLTDDPGITRCCNAVREALNR